MSKNKKFILAIQGGPKTIKKKFTPFNTFDNREVIAGSKVLKSGKLSGFVADTSNSFYGGVYVKKLERKFSSIFKVKYAISVNSWTSGLICAVGSLNIKPGDEIIVTPWTMSATATSIIFWGGVPVFSEIDQRTYCLDPKKIEEKITKKTKAIIVADIFGQSADYKSIMSIAKKRKIFVISDTAQAIGSRYFKKYSGTLSDIGGFSLNRHKHIQTGEGGIILTNNKKLALNMYKIRNHGEVVNKDKNFRNLIGYNFRMNEVEAAVGLVQLTKLNKIIKQKQKTAKLLIKLLKKLPGLVTPYTSKGNTHVFYSFPLQIDKNIIKKKKALIYNALKGEGIPISNSYINLMDYFLYTDPSIKKKYPWQFSRIKNLYSKKSKVYKEINELIKNRYMDIPFCEYHFNTKDIYLIFKAFKKVWKALSLLK